MKVIEHEFIVSCDMDGTLIRPIKNDESADVDIVNPYDGIKYGYIIHTEHVDLLRQYKGRGLFIEAWSAGGVKHAVSVVTALGLDSIVDLVRTKPIKHMDDKANVYDIVGNRVFIPKEGFYYEQKL